MANIFSPDFLAQLAESVKAQMPPAPENTGALESLSQSSTPMGMVPYNYDGPVIPDTVRYAKDEPYRPPPVPDWYRETLGRSGDEGGMSYWEGRLAAGEDPTAVYNQFLGSAQEEINRRPVATEQSQVPINGTGGHGGEYDQGNGTKWIYENNGWELVSSDYRRPQPVYPDTGFTPIDQGPKPPEDYRPTGLDPFISDDPYFSTIAEDRYIDPRKFNIDKPLPELPFPMPQFTNEGKQPFTGYELPADFPGFGNPVRQPENPSDHRYVPGQDDGFGLPIMRNPYGDRQIGVGPTTKEEREAMTGLAPDLSMIPSPEFPRSEGLFGGNIKGRKLYDLYEKLNNDRIKNAKTLGAKNDALKRILGEDLYNKYRNLR